MNYQDPDDKLSEVEVKAEIKQIVELFTARGYQEILTRLRFDPTGPELLKGLEDWVVNPDRGPDDVLVVYYTGHGGTPPGHRQYVLYTSDTVASRPSTHLQGTQLLESLIITGDDETLPLRRVLLILDTCDAGRGAEDAAGALSDLRSLWPSRTSAADEGVWVLAASRVREGAKQSVFARALAEAVALSESTTSDAQPYVGLEPVVYWINQTFKNSGVNQQARMGIPSLSGGLPPFLRNRHYDSAAIFGVDLESREVLRVADVVEHWGPKARGVEVDTQAGSYFTGRHTARAELVAWLSDGGPGMWIVTGDPGSGKSALLAHLVTSSFPEWRSALALSVDNLSPPEGSIRVALMARGKRSDEVLTHITAALGSTARSGEELCAELTARSDPVGLVVDAVDESADPADLVGAVLAPLASSPGVRLLVGARRHVLRFLPEPLGTIDLDLPKYMGEATSRSTRVGCCGLRGTPPPQRRTGMCLTTCSTLSRRGSNRRWGRTFCSHGP
jgi:hypothetical protein